MSLPASHLFRTREELEGEGLVLTGNVFADQTRTYWPLLEDEDDEPVRSKMGNLRILKRYSAGVTLEEKSDPQFAPPASLLD